MGNNVEAQALRHKTEAIKSVLVTNGLAHGYTRHTMRHVETWYSMQSFHLVPKIWQDKVEEIFKELMSVEQLAQIDAAVNFYLNGDDSALRPFIKNRVSVEIGVQTGGGGVAWRSRKFSDPLFLTPAGFLNAYPEVDEDLFLDGVQASAAVSFYRGIPSKHKLDNASYKMAEAAVIGQIGGKGYRRWLEEVKGQSYTEPRRSLLQSHATYLESGREGLQKLYSPAYVFALMRKFNAEGLQVHKADLDRIVHPRGLPVLA